MLLIRLLSQNDLSGLTQIAQRDRVWANSVWRKYEHGALYPFVAEKDGQVVGYVMGHVTQQMGSLRQRWHQKFLASFLCRRQDEKGKILQSKQVGLINEIYVCPANRRQGVARALIDCCVQTLHKAGACEVEVVLDANAAVAQALFRHMGYTHSRVLVRKQLHADEQFPQPFSRPARRQDILQLSSLVQQEILYQQQMAHAFHLVPTVDWNAYVAAKFQCPIRTHMLVIERDNQLVGYIELRISHSALSANSRLWHALKQAIFRTRRSDLQRQSRGYIEDIYVLPTFRRHGLANTLLNDGLRWFHLQQVFTIEGGIWQRNVVSLRFFQRRGFTVVKEMFRTTLCSAA